MPTARPSISASDGVIVLRSVNTVKATAPARPTPTPSRATSSGRPAAIRLPRVMTSTTEGDGQAEHLTGADQRGVLGDLDAVRGGEAGGRQRRVGRGGDLRPVVDRHRLGVVVELHLHDRVRAVLAHQPGGGGGGGHGLAVLVLGPARGEVGLRPGRPGPAPSPAGRARTRPGPAGRAGSGRSGLAASSWAISASPPASWTLALRELRAAGIQLGLSVLQLRGRGGEVGGALVEAGLRLERVVDPLDVRHGLPRGEHLLGGRALLVGDRRAVGGLQHHGAGAAGGLRGSPCRARR